MAVRDWAKNGVKALLVQGFNHFKRLVDTTVTVAFWFRIEKATQRRPRNFGRLLTVINVRGT
jgi:hypothetical protein